MAEVDWGDDIVPRTESVSPERCDAVPAAPAGTEHCRVLANISSAASSRTRKLSPSRWTVQLPGPRKRTFHEACLAAARMRDSRAKRHALAAKLGVKGAFNDSLAKLRDRGMLKDSGRIIAKLARGGTLAISLPHQTSKVSFATMQEVAFGAIAARNDAARAHKMDPRTVTTLRNLVAHTGLSADEHFVKQLGDSFDVRLPVHFVASLSADATSQELQLPMVGLAGQEAAHLTRSSWHVLVSTQRISFTQLDEGQTQQVGELRSWRSVDFVRPNVALVSSEHADTLYAGLYTVPPISHFSKMEMQGLRRATFKMLHYDLDGHPANLISAAMRRSAVIKEIGATPMVSVFHCGNHQVHLAESAGIDCAPSSSYAFLTTACTCFRMGGIFLRLVQAVVLLYDRFPINIIVGPRPPNAECVSKELMSYSVMNYKGFIDEKFEDASSSGEEDFDIGDKPDKERREKERRRRRRRHYLFKKSWLEWLEIFNGDMWSANTAGGGTHYLRD